MPTRTFGTRASVKYCRLSVSQITPRTGLPLLSNELAVPLNLAPLVSAFLRRDVNKGLVEVTGPKINGGAGYGLEVPCTYHFYGAKSFIDKLKELVEALRTDGRL